MGQICDRLGIFRAITSELYVIFQPVDVLSIW